VKKYAHRLRSSRIYPSGRSTQIVSFLRSGSQENCMLGRLYSMYSVFPGVRLACSMCSAKITFSDLQQLQLSLDCNFY
jgi:hypothetical protein